MRDVKAQDYWSKVYKRDYTDRLLEIDFQGLNNIPTINIPPGLLVLCGLNGAGKSTVVSAIKDLLGIPLSDQDLHRLNKHVINGKATVSGETKSCSNKNGDRLVDSGWSVESFAYLDSSESISIQNYIICQSNLDELLEQYEEYVLPTEDITEINYLVGKKYSSCSIRELTDVNGSDTVIPYFSVNVDGVNYDSKSMGVGEHFLMYLFWRINRMDKDTLIIVEEPETYVSITSQIHFINYLGKQMGKNGLKAILTTHSPYILSCVKNDYIRVINRMGNSVSIFTPDEDLPAEAILGLDSQNIGTFFVEDRVAYDFLSIVLEDRSPRFLQSFTIDYVGGASEITKRLLFPYSDRIKYKFVGVYDGDMRTSLDTSILKWKYCFLPGDKAIEEVMRDYLHNGNNIDVFCDYLGKDKNRVIAILSQIDGLDCHDWFIHLSKQLATDGKSAVSAFYQTMMKEDPSIESFLSELNAATL